MRLNTKLTALFLILSTVPLAVAGYLAYENGRKTLEQDTIDHLTAIKRLKEAEFNRWVQENGRSLRALADHPLVRQHAAVLAFDEPSSPAFAAARKRLLRDHFEPALREEGGFLQLSIVRASDGLVIAATDEAHQGQHKSSEAYFVEGKKHTYIQSVSYSSNLGQLVMHLSTPVEDQRGNVIAVLAGHADLAEMVSIMAQGWDLSSSEETYLVNSSNLLVTESRFEPGFDPARTVRTRGVEDCLQHNDGHGLYDDYRGVPVIGVYGWMPERELCILTEVDQTEAFANIIAMRNAVLGIGVAVALAAATLGAFVARGITGPIRELVRGAEQIGHGNLDYRIEVETGDEIGHLARAFNEMASNLRSSTGQTAYGQRLLLALSQAAQAVQRARTPDEVFRIVGDQVSGLGYNGTIFTLTDDRAHLVLAHTTYAPHLVRAGEKLTGATVRGFRIAITPGSFHDRVITRGETIYATDFDQVMGESLPGLVRPVAVPLAVLLGIRQAIYTPLAVDGKAQGLLSVTGSGLTEADVPAVSTFANQAAIALENARLYQEARARAAELETAYGELRDAQEQVLRSERLAVLGQLAGGVGHELRNPLGSINNAVYLLNMILEDPVPGVTEALEILKAEVAESDRIISSLIDFARAEPPTRRRVDLNGVVREALSRATVPETVEVVTRLDERLPTMMADAHQLALVFGNIITNAVQAMSDAEGVSRGGRLEIWSAVALPADSAHDQEWVVVAITDTGVGNPAENLDKLFEPLFTTKAKGIGLGLALSKILVDGHGGTIEVESEVGKGSTFTVRLPLD